MIWPRTTRVFDDIIEALEDFDKKPLQVFSIMKHIRKGDKFLLDVSNYIPDGKIDEDIIADFKTQVKKPRGAP